MSQARDAAAGRWLQALTDGSREVVALVSGSGHVRYLSLNRALVEMLGYNPRQLTGVLNLSLLHPDDVSRVTQAFADVAAQAGGRMTIDHRLRHQHGHFLRVQSTAVNRLSDPAVAAVVVHIRSNDSEPPVAASEPVRGLPDRALFSEAVGHALARAQAEPGYGFSVLLLELDRLKMMAGNYGQEVVQLLLKTVGRRLGRLMRPQDTLAQLEGGEFAILLEGVGDRNQAHLLSERIQKTVGVRYDLDGHHITVSALVGIATNERHYEKAGHVLRDAALAANRARNRGRKRRAVFQTQMRVEDTKYMTLVSELHNASQAQQFRLFYQPIVSLDGKQLYGFEALLRWDHPERGVVSPAEFIPVAEETGLIVQIGQWVLREACRQMAVWHQRFPRAEPLHVSVNLSPKQFAEEDLTSQVEQALADSGLDGHHLKLEITESTVLENHESASVALHRLKKLGVRVSLDDFGTGYSSFSYLHQLPYDTLKIDRSFVSRIGADGENGEIVHAIITLAHNLSMDVVAEGVETATQARRLAEMACEYAQGYHYARPMPAERAEVLIATDQRRH